MRSMKEIRNDIKEIRYYYSRQKEFDNASKTIAEATVLRKAEEYRGIIKHAPPRLFDLYLSYVVNKNSQEVVAEDWGYCVENIKYFCRKMYEFLFNELNKSETEK